MFPHMLLSLVPTGGLVGHVFSAEVGDGVGVGVGLGELLLELGEQCLVLLVQDLRLPPQPLVLLHYVAVLQVQL